MSHSPPGKILIKRDWHNINSLYRTRSSRIKWYSSVTKETNSLLYVVTAALQIAIPSQVESIQIRWPHLTSPVSIFRFHLLAWPLSKLHSTLFASREYQDCGMLRTIKVNSCNLTVHVSRRLAQWLCRSCVVEKDGRISHEEENKGTSLSIAANSVQTRTGYIPNNSRALPLYNPCP
jgi:hypothetical protein